MRVILNYRNFYFLNFLPFITCLLLSSSFALASTLAIHGGEKLFNEGVTYPWPQITPEVESAVIKQLHTSMSQYTRSGITAEFEDAFKDLHHSPDALVTSNGTSALHSAYYALGFGPGDEVIVPDYTFFATAMPLFQLGALPVLVDSDKFGGIDPEAIEKQITSATKGIVVTHIWGTPCRMDEIVALCKKYKLKLVEDCSHAHGARYHNQLVGTFGDIGIWSLQSKKIIAAGEGGIMVFKEKKHYERAQLLGHFNKRSLQEIDKNSENYKHAVTGTGLKYRPNALGLAIAMTQLPKLTKWIENKNENAKFVEKTISSVPGIYPLAKIMKGINSAYYAYTFIVDEKLCGFSRHQLVDAMRAEGFADIDAPKSTSSLHRMYIFKNPVSPVYKYSKNGIRGSYKNSEYISDHQVKISIPVEATTHPKTIHFLKAFESCWKKVTHGLLTQTQQSREFK